MSSLECIVCSKAFKKHDEVKVTPCSHIFHCQCFNSCFKASKQCPKCDEILTSADINSMIFDSTTGSRKSSSKNDAFIDRQNEMLNLLKEIALGNRRESHRRRRRDSSDSEEDDYSQRERSRRREVAERGGAEIVNRNGNVFKCNEIRPISVNINLNDLIGISSLFGKILGK